MEVMDDHLAVRGRLKVFLMGRMGFTLRSVLICIL
jgi:hypothetical protein